MSSECIVTEITDDSRKDSLEDLDDFGDEEIGNKKENFTAFSSQLSELEKLIVILKKGIRDKEPGIKYIKYPELLVTALEELNGMIGLDRIKESAAIQTVRLIENLKEGKKSMSMLNTVLCGNMGCGKTSCSIKLAKIWYALGFLSPATSTTTTTTKKNTFFETPKGGGMGMDYSSLALIFIVWIGTYIIQLLSYAYNAIGLFWFAFFIGFFLFVIILIYYSDKEGKWITKYITTEKEVTEETLKNASDRDIITVVSRNDFVGEFLGHTAGKTRKLLEANIGKVLFIDEAYSLLNDPRDAYGYECLNTLNLFLSENPDKIVVIFAGYKEQMKASIFTAQPGLERRCMWTFNIDPYTGDELSQIFFLMSSQEDWYISEKDKILIRRLIMKNESAFKASAGDISRLLYLASLEASRGNLSGISESFLSCVGTEEDKTKEKKRILTYHDVEQGLISLKENKL